MPSLYPNGNSMKTELVVPFSKNTYTLTNDGHKPFTLENFILNLRKILPLFLPSASDCTAHFFIFKFSKYPSRKYKLTHSSPDKLLWNRTDEIPVITDTFWWPARTGDSLQPSIHFLGENSMTRVSDAGEGLSSDTATKVSVWKRFFNRIPTLIPVCLPVKSHLFCC